MINAIRQSNCVIPPVNRSGGRYSPVNFTASQNQNEQDSKTQERNLDQNKIFWGAVALGSAIGLAIIGKKEFPMLKLKFQVKRSYDKIWKDVVKDFDKANLQIEKPKLKFSFNKNSNTWGHYDFRTNSIEMNLHHLKNKEYLIYKGDGKSRIFRSGGEPFFNLNDIEKMKEEGKLDSSWSIKKATLAEKLFYSNAKIAHEQRHCAQFHLILNDSQFGSNFILKDTVEQLKKIKHNLSEEELLNLAKNESPYLANFKPKRDVTNLHLTLQATVEGKKHVFMTKNFARNFSEYTDKDLNKYNINSLEIDANAYAWTYIKFNKEIQKGCGDDVLAFILNLQKAENADNISRFVDANSQYMVRV